VAMGVIGTEAELRRLCHTPGERAVRKELRHLDRHCRRFIELSPFVVLATSDASGRLDASPRADAPGFVLVTDEGTLTMPDWPGNNRLDSLTNLLSNPEVGLLFLIPGVDETLRVNGRAEIRDDLDLRAAFGRGDRMPRTVLRIRVREAYLHCAKALMRSGLWDPRRQVPRSVLPSMGEMLRDQTHSTEPVESQSAMVERYRQILY
jgi:PPOX class probable FMN-dependent enzyme